MFHTLAFVAFTNLNKAIPVWDSAGHIATSYLIKDNVGEFIAGEGSLTSIFKSSTYYPPLIQSTGAVVSFLFGYNHQALLVLGFTFFVLTLFYLNKLIYLLTKSTFLTFSTVAIFSFFPFVFNESRNFHLDIPLVFFSVLTILYFVKSNLLNSKKNTLLFFTFFALAQLTKWYAFTYVLPFIICYFAYRIGFSTLKNSYKNITTGLGIFLALTLPWYLYNFNSLVEDASIFSKGEVGDPSIILSVANFAYYPREVMIYGILLVPSILLVISFLYLLTKNTRQFLLILVSVLTPFVTFLLIGNKNIRYLVPLAPYFAYVISFFVYHISKRFNRVLLGALLCYQILAFAFLSFNQIKYSTPVLRPIGKALAGSYYEKYFYDPQFYSYTQNYWPTKEVLMQIALDADYLSKKPVGVLVVSENQYLSSSTLEMLRYELGLGSFYYPSVYFKRVVISDLEILNFLDDNQIDYAIVSENVGMVESTRNFEILTSYVNYFNNNTNPDFVVLNSYFLPDGSGLKIYKRTTRSW